MSDEVYYEFIAKELEDGSIRKGLWLQSTTEANGDESRAKAIYVKHRLKELKRSGIPRATTTAATTPAKTIEEFANKQIYIAERLRDANPPPERTAEPSRPRRKIDWPAWLLLLALALIHSAVMLHLQGEFHGEVFAYLLPSILGGTIAALLFPLIICLFVKPPGRYWVAFVGFLIVAFFMSFGVFGSSPR